MSVYEQSGGYANVNSKPLPDRGDPLFDEGAPKAVIELLRHPPPVGKLEESEYYEHWWELLLEAAKK